MGRLSVACQYPRHSFAQAAGWASWTSPRSTAEVEEALPAAAAAAAGARRRRAARAAGAMVAPGRRLLGVEDRRVVAPRRRLLLPSSIETSDLPSGRVDNLIALCSKT